MEVLTEGERSANDAILKAMESVKVIDTAHLLYNRDELTMAVHTLQDFVKQHILHRLFPNEYGAWYGEEG